MVRFIRNMKRVGSSLVLLSLVGTVQHIQADPPAARVHTAYAQHASVGCLPLKALMAETVKAYWHECSQVQLPLYDGSW